MIEKVMKAVKSSNKRRGRNITIGAVIGFLLSCTAVMGTDNYLWIKEDGGEIKFSIDGTTTSDGDWKTENPYENAGNIWDKDTEPKTYTYTNNMTLLSSVINGKDEGIDKSYGLRLSGDMSNVNFVNNGSIIGAMEMNTSGSGYGIYNTGKMGNIANTGEISGTSTKLGAGYGILNYNSATKATIGNITNAGKIKGFGYNSTNDTVGYGIYNSEGTIGNIENTGEISGSGYGSGSGIDNGSSKIGNITNIGIIIGTGNSSGVNGKGTTGYGILNYSGEIEDITNTGVISGTGNSSNNDDGTGSGIDNATSKMENITNTGVISGTGISTGGNGTGSGIDNESGTNGDIANTGLISGYGESSGNNKTGEGSGIYNYNSEIKNIKNTGLISGYGSSEYTGRASGIANFGKIGNIANIGIIIGSGISDNDGTGFGIANTITLENIKNTGVIIGTGSGTSSASAGIYDNNDNSSGREIENITNTGVIYGTDNAIKNDGSGTINTVNNYGILVNGKNQDVNAGTITNMNNYGLIIKNGSEIVDESKVKEEIKVEIEEYDDNGNVKSTRKMTIKNKKVTDGSQWFTGNENDSILNALKDTYKVTDLNDKVTGSIINAYGTAVVFEGDNNQLTLSGTIVNGGIDENDSKPGTKVATILGSSNGDNLILQSGKIKYKDTNGVEKYATQNTVVNGNIDMKDGDDTLTVGDGTIINGTLDGGDGEDTLNFGISSGAKSNSSESEGVRILHNISNFENMNINTNVTLFEKTIGTDGKETNLEVTDVSKITIGKDGNLILRIDGTNKNSHALLGNTGGAIESDGGKLLLALNGVGEGSTIDIKMKLEDSMYGVENTDIEYSDKFTLDTTSVLHSVKRKNDSDSEVIVTSKSELPLSPNTPEDVNYEKLNKIYQSMRVVDGVKEFNVDSNEKLSIFLGYLNDIYTGNPYSYSSELSRKSVGMFRDIAVESQFKPELNKWLIMGGLTHVDGGTKDTYYGKGYYTYDIGSSDMDADTKITGAYILGEYGVSDTLTYGVVIGGNKLKSELSNDSKVDGDALYMGAYAKKYVGNLKVTGGLGLQYGDYDADRIAVNKVASSLAEPVMKYSDNYNDMTYDIYLNGRYSHNIGENLFLEPYGTLSYTYIKQDSADEGSKVLAIETDSKSFDYTAAKVGVDLKKVIPHEKGKSTLSAGVSYTRLLNGVDEENITGRFKGENATDFDILVAHKNEHSIGLNAKYALELENGILFDVKGSYSVERDSHNGTGKNRAKGEWIVGAGLGYKF
ncbi:autotransporter outer membrane beta-barrel domain-containing protein [Fusobacterium varium]|uniref:autotransporter outer membrane beta-barrel domain-containing protein n=1 Tax=Fusobacterium varium TaxID=856 RepID=UPI001F2F9238|nr:autotransporter outer membrane beta-barrel domain-containing protein [Fusobacterium varium]MCF2674676.1 autotransporter outer membrane beta-barrel domain-containing protein [Fusobacterium varium]